jgi:hypothetical protein
VGVAVVALVILVFLMVEHLDDGTRRRGMALTELASLRAP